MLRLLKRSALSLAALLPLLLLASTPAAQAPAENPNIRFGLPAPAKADPASREAYLIARPQYVLSYNDRTRTANWVCWRSATAPAEGIKTVGGQPIAKE